jgi:SAM-dependent methyltransferase
MTDYLDHRFDDSAAFAAHYDELPLWSAPFGQLLLEHVPFRRGMRVVDLACGTGFPLFELAQRLGATGSRWASIRGAPPCFAHPASDGRTASPTPRR